MIALLLFWHVHFLVLDTYFLPVINYLLFSICDFLGRVMSNLIQMVIIYFTIKLIVLAIFITHNLYLLVKINKKMKLKIWIFIILQPNDSIWPSAVLSISRTIFIPVLMLSNANPRHYLPILIANDQFYAVIISLFGFTNGIINNITMASIPQ